MNRAVSISQLYATKYDALPLEGAFKDLIGCPEIRGSWIIWGESGHGKTTFVLMLLQYLSRFVRCAYDTLEEGTSLSIQDAAKRVGLVPEDDIIFLDQEEVSELKERLRKRRAPEIIVIDSAQYSGLTPLTYKQLLKEFPSKLFIFISHEKNGEPKGSIGEAIKYDANVKIRVEGYAATLRTSRYMTGQSKPFVIWDEGYEKYWAEIN